MCCNKSSRCGGFTKRRQSRIRQFYNAYVATLERGYAQAQVMPGQGPTEQAPPSYTSAVFPAQSTSGQTKGKHGGWQWIDEKPEAQLPQGNSNMGTKADFDQFEAAVMHEARQFVERQRVQRQ